MTVPSHGEAEFVLKNHWPEIVEPTLDFNGYADEKLKSREAKALQNRSFRI